MSSGYNQIPNVMQTCRVIFWGVKQLNNRHVVQTSFSILLKILFPFPQQRTGSDIWYVTYRNETKPLSNATGWAKTMGLLRVIRTASLSEELLISSCKAFRRPIRVRKYATWWKSELASSYTWKKKRGKGDQGAITLLKLLDSEWLSNLILKVGSKSVCGRFVALPTG